MTFNTQTYRKEILTLFEDFSFRRVFRVNYVPNIPNTWMKICLSHKNTLYKTLSSKKFPEDNILCETLKCQRFHGFTVLQEENGDYPEQSLYFSSQNECNLNEYGHLVPLLNYDKGFPPKKDQLICGIISKEPVEKCRPFVKWFKCSEAFYKTITALRKGKCDVPVQKMFQMIETNKLRMLVEKLDKTNIYDMESLLYETSLLEFNESFSKISFFYQFLLYDCLFDKLELSWKDIHNTSFYDIHKNLYILFKTKVMRSYSSSSSIGHDNISVTFPSTITISNLLE